MSAREELQLGDSTALGRKLQTSQMPLTAVYIRWGVAGFGFALLIALLLVVPPESVTLWWLYVAAIAVSEIFLSVRLRPGSYYSPAPVFVILYFVLSGGIAAAVVEAAGSLIAWAGLRLLGRSRQTPTYGFFRAGQSIVAVIVAAILVQPDSPIPVLRSPILFEPVSTMAIFALVYLLMIAFLDSAAAYALGGFQEVRTRLWPTATLWQAISVGTAWPFAVVILLLAPTAGTVLSTLFVFVFLAGLAMILKLNVRLREGNADLRAINRIGTMITSTLDLSSLFSLLAKESRQVLKWDSFFIATRDQDREKLNLVFVSGAGVQLAQRSIPFGAGLTGRAIQTGEMVHYERDERDTTLGDDELRGIRRSRSMVVAPMRVGDEVIGAISVQSFQPDAYGGHQMQVLQTIAAQAAIAIRNAQLFESEAQARAERDEFLGLVTHEIKNPLTSIRGFSEIAEDAVRNGRTEEAADSLAVIRSEARRILRLAEDLLDASKMAAGKFSFKAEEVQLPEIVSQIAERYRTTSSRVIRLETSERFPMIRGDSTRLAQIVENLVSNAVKYSPEQTPVTISLDYDEASVRLTVKDQGNGIPPEKLPLIFERFYRIEDSGHEVKGTGLGLYITREIVRMHGGRIDVDSRDGEGSRFIVELPRGESVVRETEDESSAVR
ncbi:MAG: GAF domain-containing sensor histidine kinase [Thermoanaerobaculia bacterium]